MLCGIAIIQLHGCGEDYPPIPTYPLIISSIFPDTIITDNDDYLALPVSMIQLGDELLVSDQGRNEIIRYSLDGGFLGTIGRTGSGPGELNSIYHLRDDRQGTGFWVRAFAGGRLIHFNVHGEYISSFRPLFSLNSFDVLDDGSLVITCGPGVDHGTLVRLSDEGEVIWEASPTLEIAGTSGFIPATNASGVAVLDGVIWQFYTSFNVIRTFSSDGVMLKEFSLREEYVATLHEQNVDKHLELAGGNLSTGPLMMYMNVREARGSIWLSTQVSAVLPEELRYRRYFYEINASGSIENRYYIERSPIDGLFADFMPVIRGGKQYLVILTAHGDVPPCLVWCETGPIESPLPER
ncbi:hypothetical protein ACFL6R_00170 [Gemmatimonadota bacterium]